MTATLLGPPPPGTGPATTLARMDRVSVRYSGTQAWVPEGVTLDLPAATTTLLLGPSGCGKSTITLTLNGLVPHSVPSAYRGSVLVAGQEVAEADTAHLARNVAMVMQDPDSQVVTTKVLDEVCYALENLCLPVEQIEPRAVAALEAVGVSHLAQVSPWELSGGQRQRVVLASALAVEPTLLVLDEPTANLDPAGSAGFYALLPRLKARGTAVLVVEHDLDDLIASIDHVIALDGTGRTIAVGPPQEVFTEHGQALGAAGIRLPTAVRLHRQLHQRGLLPGPAPEPARAGSPAAPPLPLTLDQAAAELATVPAARWEPIPADDRPAPGTGTGTGLHGPTAAWSSKPVLVVTDLVVPRGRGRRRHEVLHGVSLTVRRGEVLAVVGANGSGKSTLLRALAGLEPWTSGTVQVAGRQRRPGRPGREVTMVMQNPEHQFLERTVHDELAHGMRLDGAGSAEVEDTVKDLLQRFHLEQRAGANPFLLSGGQQRRLSVASVLVERRELICLDEPTFGQDRHSAEALMGSLHEVAAQGTGIVLSTHDMELAAEHADAVLVLSAGRVLAQGAPEKVLSETGLLGRAGLRPPAIAQITAAARDLGARPPSWVSWKGLL